MSEVTSRHSSADEGLTQRLCGGHRIRHGDGAVSIFGLVLGVAVAPSPEVPCFLQVLRRVAASVSMMAGLYLDLESERGESPGGSKAPGSPRSVVILTMQ